MNMQAIMAQAKKLQGELEKTTKEIEEKEFLYKSDNVLILATGNNKISKIEIINKSLLDDEEMLEDILLVGFNSILSQIKSEKENKLGKYTGGMGGLF